MEHKDITNEQREKLSKCKTPEDIRDPGRFCREDEAEKGGQGPFLGLGPYHCARV